jgi:hypothetical protein
MPYSAKRDHVLRRWRMAATAMHRPRQVFRRQELIAAEA